MADEIIITKQTNSVILVTNAAGNPYTLLSNYRVQKNASNVEILDNKGGIVDTFTPDAVEKVVLIDGSEVAIPDLDTLFTQLITNFFFANGVGLIGPTGDLEFISDANLLPGEDGNYRFKMVGGALQTQRKVTGVWTPLEEI